MSKTQAAVPAGRYNLRPSARLSLIPVVALLAAMVWVIVKRGADSILDLSPILLGGAALLAFLITRLSTRRPMRLILMGIAKSGRQILPAIPILILIATLATTWMLSGTVPLIIDAGLRLLHPGFFLPAACAICAIISVVTGSSWTTIATIGLAFMGIGTILGLSPGWVAGAIISGAYFGDKVSPLSDTTVLASSSCSVDLFRHIRNMMYTTIPAMAIALTVYLIVGLTADVASASASSGMADSLRQTFNLSPWLALVPVITCIMISFRLPTLIVLGAGTIMGVAAMWIFQPEITSHIMTDSASGPVLATILTILRGTTLDTGSAAIDDLTSTSGIMGMMPTIYLILGAMLFGGVMIGSGMLKILTRSFIRRLRRRHSLVGATVASGLFLNCCTGDQYISIIIGGNVYRPAYHRAGFPPELLSRSLEDSISVTSVLIPWNSCGMTQSTVLGVATLVYAPFCIFNIMSPLMSIAAAWRKRRLEVSMAK